MSLGNTQSLDTLEITKRAKEVLEKEPGLELAILYGSVATGKASPDSDVDIALL